MRVGVGGASRSALRIVGIDGFGQHRLGILPPAVAIQCSPADRQIIRIVRMRRHAALGKLHELGRINARIGRRDAGANHVKVSRSSFRLLALYARSDRFAIASVVICNQVK